MEVLVTVPDSILKDIEFIPAEVLPRVFSDLVVESIKKKTEPKKRKADEASVDLASLLATLQQSVNLNPSTGSESAKAFKEVNTAEPVKIEQVNVDLNFEDGLDDFMDFMK